MNTNIQTLTLEELAAFTQRKYTGYLWLSDQTSPRVLQNEALDLQIYSTQNPFIVEAWLYCKEEGISISIAHTGNYTITSFPIDELKKQYPNSEEKVYLGHKLHDLKPKFTQLWAPQADPLCSNMETLTIKAIVFTGFETTKDQKNGKY